eukprot:scaffold374_cov271-Pinguiococcus_pyrenoidosus.AAC.11
MGGGSGKQGAAPAVHAHVERHAEGTCGGHSQEDESGAEHDVRRMERLETAASKTALSRLRLRRIFSTWVDRFMAAP